MRILTILIFMGLFAKAQSSLTFDSGMYGLYNPKNSQRKQAELFAIPYVDISYKRMHFFPRYNFDILHTGSLNMGYDVIRTQNKNLVFTPSFGWTLGAIKGPIAGFQISVSHKNFQFYGINQYLFSTEYKNAQNWYTWSEVNYKIFKFFRPGFSIFLRQFPIRNQTFLDLGPVFITEFNRLKISAYLMNPWNEKFYVFVGIGYLFETKSKTLVNSNNN